MVKIVIHQQNKLKINRLKNFQIKKKIIKNYKNFIRKKINIIKTRDIKSQIFSKIDIIFIYKLNGRRFS